MAKKVLVSHMTRSAKEILKSRQIELSYNYSEFTENNSPKKIVCTHNYFCMTKKK